VFYVIYATIDYGNPSKQKRQISRGGQAGEDRLSYKEKGLQVC